MITCELMGGLGNQLFQIFATISYAIEMQQPFKFLNIFVLGNGYNTIRYTYWNSFLKKLSMFLYDNKLTTPFIISERRFQYDALIKCDTFVLNKYDIMLKGYFQSYKYFEKHYQQICRLICLEQIKTDVLYKSIIDKCVIENAISIHFRLGDYKKIQHIHPILTDLYYKKSLSHIKTITNTLNHVIVYFCEKEDIELVNETINKLKVDFPSYIFIRCEPHLNDWEQMIIMSKCCHNIIANSTFSWWGAYFNSNQDKIVCYPSKWFGDAVCHNTNDLCPSTWTKINID